jgi:hypothetical protein
MTPLLGYIVVVTLCLLIMLWRYLSKQNVSVNNATTMEVDESVSSGATTPEETITTVNEGPEQLVQPSSKRIPNNTLSVARQMTDGYWATNVNGHLEIVRG